MTDTPPTIDLRRVIFTTWWVTVRQLGDASTGGLTLEQVERVRRELLPGGMWPEGSVPADLEPKRSRLLDEVCHGLAAGVVAPDFPPDGVA